ncbi:hypothetical protein Bca101_053410 [Brassica carinata]
MGFGFTFNRSLSSLSRGLITVTCCWLPPCRSAETVSDERISISGNALLHSILDRHIYSVELHFWRI